MSLNSSAKLYCKGNVHLQNTYFLETLNHVSILSGFHCLDIGCGTGNVCSQLANIVASSGSVVGIDPDETRINTAKEQHQQCNINFFCLKSIDFPLADGGYDFINCNAVLHWIPREEKLITFKRVYTALKPGGIFAVNCCKDVPRNIRELYKLCSTESVAKVQSGIHFETDDVLKDFIAKSGLKIIRFEDITYTTYFENDLELVKLLDATMHNGVLGLTDKYKSNIKKVNFERHSDGKIIHRSTYTCMILKKPTE